MISHPTFIPFTPFWIFRPLWLPGSQIRFMTLSNHLINISCFSFYHFFVYCLVTLAPLLMNCDVKAAGKSKFHCRSMSLLEPVSKKYYACVLLGSHLPISFYYHRTRSSLSTSVFLWIVRKHILYSKHFPIHNSLCIHP